ncbi:MAG: hypothetical protein ACNI27_07020 [Desulfovibrio sp.]
MSDLEKCVCGGEPEIMTLTARYSVCCLTCFMSGPNAKNEADACRNWNAVLKSLRSDKTMKEVQAEEVTSGVVVIAPRHEVLEESQPC